MYMAAVVKAALAEILREFHKALFYSAEAQVVQAEGLHAGAVDQAAGLVYPVQPRVSGGVLAGIQHCGDFAGDGVRVGQQRVDQRGFAHAGLADQHAGVAGKKWPQRGYILYCAEFQHAIADRGVGGEPFARGRGGSGQVAFVQHDQHG